MLLNCDVGEDSWESFGLQRDQTSNSKGNQPWIFIGRTDAEAEAQILWPPDAKSQFIGKDPDAGKDWRQKEKGTVEDKIDSFTNSMDMNLNKLWELVVDRGVWPAAVQGVENTQTQLMNWTAGRLYYAVDQGACVCV